MSNSEKLPSDRRQDVDELQDTELDAAVAGAPYVCVRVEWFTVDDKGTILPVHFPC
jgi:hypothetical protein